MYAATSNPLRMNPPEILLTPSSPSTTPPSTSHSFYALPHASTSSARIVSPIILIPGHDALSTTLTPQQLSQLLPTLHIYIEPAHPSIAILPSVGISHVGLRMALLWREADLQGSSADMASDLSELVQMYQALAFLGNKSTSRSLWILNKMILFEIDVGLSLSEYQELWALRHLPFTEPFIEAIVKRVTMMEVGLTDLMGQPQFQSMRKSDAEFSERIDTTVLILHWVYDEESFAGKLERMRVKLAREVKKAARFEKRGGVSALKGFRVGLETVLE